MILFILLSYFIYLFIFNELRLDAGTFGTMGIGLPSAIAASLWCQDNAPDKRVLCIQGDSAFGFSALEVETACRLVLNVYRLIYVAKGSSFYVLPI